MNLIEFPEQTVVIAKDQPEYRPLPAFQFANDPEGKLACCWQLTWRERFKLLFTGKLWHQILTFHQPLQPQLLLLVPPFTGADIAAVKGAKKRAGIVAEFRFKMLAKYGDAISHMHSAMNLRGYHGNDRRRCIKFVPEDFARAKELGVLFLDGARIVNSAHETAVP